MKKLGDLLNNQNLEKKISKEEKKDQRLRSAWSACMGEACSLHTNKLKLKNGKLTVYMDSQVWQQELMFSSKKEMASDMARETGYTVVDVIIKTGG